MTTLTVYFDTSFFVWLRKANSELASETLNNLNSLRVRHVLSDALIKELLASSRDPNDDAILVDRVNKFALPPLLLRDAITWDVLLSQGETRTLVAGVLKLCDDLATEASSHAIMGRRIADGNVSAEEVSQLMKSLEPFLDENGLSLDLADQEKNYAAARAFAESLIENAKAAAPEGTISGELDWSGDPFKDSQMLFGLLSPEDLERAEESNRLNDSTTSSENRAFQVATGTATGELKKNLAHTLRDSEHLSTFVLHRDEIDLCQVDRAQLNLINANPKHRINELGLAHRCFKASGLKDVVSFLTSVDSSKKSNG